MIQSIALCRLEKCTPHSVCSYILPRGVLSSGHAWMVHAHTQFTHVTWSEPHVTTQNRVNTKLRSWIHPWSFWALVACNPGSLSRWNRKYHSTHNYVLFPSPCSAASQSQPSIDSTFCLFLFPLLCSWIFCQRWVLRLLYSAILFNTGHMYDVSLIRHHASFRRRDFNSLQLITCEYSMLNLMMLEFFSIFIRF